MMASKTASKDPSREDGVNPPLRGKKTPSRRAASVLIVVAVLCCAQLFNKKIKIGPVSSSTEFKRTRSNGTAQLMHMHNATPPLAGGLWIYVSSWAEGISNWRKSLTEILIVAHRLNATLVEPCICQGRMVSCQKLGDVPTSCINSAGTMTKLSDIFDMERMKQFHPAIASFDDFQRHTDAQKTELATKQQASFTMCMNRLKDPCGEIEWGHKSEKSMVLKKAVHQSHLVRTTLEMTHFRRTAFVRMMLGKVKLVDPSEILPLARKYLDFRSEHYQIVDHALDQMGVNKNFSVIHWRGELQNMDYMECARAILKTRDQMHTPDRQFVLMSSLNMDATLQWGGARKRAKNSTAHAALSLLLDTGFYKLDTVIEGDKDIVRLAVWDIILAVKAQAFATCAGCDAESEICAKCNYQGNFARWAVEMRQMSGKQSRKCW
jgi:hypothetical protein